MSSDFWKNEKVRVFTTLIDNISFEEAQNRIIQFLAEPKFHRIYTPNTEIVMEAIKDKELTSLVNSADLVVADGIGLIIGSRMKSLPIKERVTGYDLSIFLLQYAEENGLGIFLLGGAPGVAEKARENLRVERPRLQITGCQNGYFKGAHIGQAGHEEEKQIIDSINKSGAQILFVGLGFPKQEIWIDENKDKLENIRLAIGNGGVIDILGGIAKRAPQIFIDLHLEWFYRLIKNPSRIKRQLAIPKFLLKIIKDPHAVETAIVENEEEK